MRHSTTNRLYRVITAVLTMMALMAGQRAWATEHTVTYTFTYSSNQLTFTPSNSGFGTSTGTKEVTIQNTQSTNGFDVQLDDGVTLRLSLKANSSIFFVHNGDNTPYGISLNTNGDQQVRFVVSCTDYYITHVKLAQPNGTALVGTGTPAPLQPGPLDVDVDIDKSTYNHSDYNAHVTQSTNFGQLTITLSDTPRPYTITYVDAVDGVKYVTNTNPTTYNVATLEFQITAPTRTGFTFEGFYKNAEFSGSPEALPLTIERGVAAKAKDRTFYAKWSVIPWSGNGSENTPYLIQYPSQLDLLAANVNAGNDYEGKFFKLDADLPFSNAGLGDNESNFTAIGTDSHPFKGTFNGDSKTISGIRINKSTVDNQGLFGYVGSGGTVKNVILNDAVITGQAATTGAIVGNNAGTITANYYHACSVNSATTNVGTSSGDTDGARSVHAITLPESVTATGESVEIGSTAYYVSSATITLGYSNLPSNSTALYAYNDGSDHAIEGNTFTMPACDVTVSTAVFKTKYITHWQAGFAHDGSCAEKAYLITTPEGLSLLASEVNGGNNFEGKYFKLDGNIDMNSVSDFTPIGNSDNFNKQFMGFFDGDGHTISHLTINQSGKDNIGLFGKLNRSSTISGVTLNQANITGKSNVGGIAGYTENPLVTISNCHVVNSAITSTSSSGAIVGNNSNGTLTGNTYHSTLVYAPETPINAFNIGCGDGDSDGATLDATQYFVNNRTDLAALLAAYYEPSKHTAHNGTAPDLSQITAYVRENVTIPSGSVFEANSINTINNNYYVTLADGAQLIFRNDVVNCPIIVQKHIAPYTDGQNDGWNLISLPFNSNVGTNAIAGLIHDAPDVYDLYRLNLMDNSYWENSKQQAQDMYILGPSYVPLYASSKETTLENRWTQGTYAETEEGTKVYLLKSEWNVTGNPYTFNAYVNRPYYRLNAEGSAFELVKKYWEVPVPVFGAVVMKANHEVVCAYDSIYFTRKAPPAPSSLDADKTIHSILPPAMLPLSHGSAGNYRFMTVLNNDKDNSAIIAEKKGQTSDVFALRERVLYKDGEWNTLCLPFPMSAEQIDESPLAGADIRTLSSSSFENETLTLNFTPAAPAEGAVTSIKAGMPYLIKWTKPDPYAPYIDNEGNERYTHGDDCSDIYYPEFLNVTIPNDYKDGSVSTEWIDFKGITSRYVLPNVDRTMLYLAVGNKLVTPNASYTVKSCRGYFQLKKGLELDPSKPNLSRGIVLNFGDGDATGIEDFNSSTLQFLNSDTGWYTLDGRKLSGKPTRKGLYIHNGIKYAIQ